MNRKEISSMRVRPHTKHEQLAFKKLLKAAPVIVQVPEELADEHLLDYVANRLGGKLFSTGCGSIEYEVVGKTVRQIKSILSHHFCPAITGGLEICELSKIS